MVLCTISCHSIKQQEQVLCIAAGFPEHVVPKTLYFYLIIKVNNYIFRQTVSPFITFLKIIEPWIWHQELTDYAQGMKLGHLQTLIHLCAWDQCCRIALILQEIFFLTMVYRLTP